MPFHFALYGNTCAELHLARKGVNTSYPFPRESDRAVRVDRASAHPRNWISIHVMPGIASRRWDEMLGNFLVPLSGPSRDNRYSVRSGRGVRSQPGKYCRSSCGSDGIEQKANRYLINDTYFAKVSKDSSVFLRPSVFIKTVLNLVSLFE